MFVYKYSTGWWFGIFVMFHNIWDVILPIDFMFQDGFFNHQAVFVYKYNNYVFLFADIILRWTGARQGLLFSCWHHACVQPPGCRGERRCDENWMMWYFLQLEPA